jgi:hypothetical protein
MSRNIVPYKRVEPQAPLTDQRVSCIRLFCVGRKFYVCSWDLARALPCYFSDVYATACTVGTSGISAVNGIPLTGPWDDDVYWVIPLDQKSISNFVQDYAAAADDGWVFTQSDIDNIYAQLMPSRNEAYFASIGQDPALAASGKSSLPPSSDSESFSSSVSESLSDSLSDSEPQEVDDDSDLQTLDRAATTMARTLTEHGNRLQSLIGQVNDAAKTLANVRDEALRRYRESGELATDLERIREHELRPERAALKAEKRSMRKRERLVSAREKRLGSRVRARKEQ